MSGVGAQIPGSLLLTTECTLFGNSASIQPFLFRRAFWLHSPKHAEPVLTRCVSRSQLLGHLGFINPFSGDSVLQRKPAQDLLTLWEMLTLSVKRHSRVFQAYCCLTSEPVDLFGDLQRIPLKHMSCVLLWMFLDKINCHSCADAPSDEFSGQASSSDSSYSVGMCGFWVPTFSSSASFLLVAGAQHWHPRSSPSPSFSAATPGWTDFREVLFSKF